MIENLIDKLIPILSIVFSAGLVLYFDGLIFSGGKGWVKGMKNAFQTINKGFFYFLANIVGIIIASYFLEKLISWVLFTYKIFFLPTIILLLSLLYFYYLNKYTKKGLKRWRVPIIILIVIGIYFLFGNFFKLN